MGFKRVSGALTLEGQVVGLRLETDKGQTVDLETDIVSTDSWVKLVNNINVERLELKPHKDKLVTEIEVQQKKTFRNITQNKLWADKAVEFVQKTYG